MSEAQPQQAPDMDAINKILGRFQNKLSEATTQVILLEAELESKNARIAELEEAADSKSDTE